MQRPNAASCLFLAFLSVAPVCPAAGRLKVQVVQTHTGVKLDRGDPDLAGDSNPAWSRCSGSSGTYSREFAFHCGDSRMSPPPEMENRRIEALFYDIQVIMPNDARLVFHCSTVLDRNCEGFPIYPENTAVVCSDFVYGEAAYKDCIASGPADGIGVYRASLHGDRMTIFGSHWRRNYIQYGTWRLEGRDPQDPKPTQEPPETKPTAAPDTRTAADGTADAKIPNPAVTSLAAAAETVIDPRVIEQAKAGDMLAQYTLGYDYYRGRGVPTDYVQAAIWWRKAAEQGYPQAQNNLGVLYNTGKGVPQSYAEAYFWQNLAAARASGDLQTLFARNRDESGSRLWLLSRLKVQQRAAKWAADHPVPPRSHEPADAKRTDNP
jgi:Sel1 repeat